ncbi:MAG: M1 family metallopeptidase [Saprospiraceae bacterium]|nr:M1 family metallopeptidase [Saprospiraceae bacterium]
MKSFLTVILLFLVTLTFGQQTEFTHQDTLRGSITKERSWWDLEHYNLQVTINPADSTLKGTNTIIYKVLKPYQVMQIDLQPPMRITSVLQGKSSLAIRKDGNAHFIEIKQKQKIGATNEITIHFEGKPQVSKRPPWSGGVTWAKDDNGNDLAVTTCQGDGASLWWPCKDHMYDEPDNGMLISLTVPENLTGVANGRLKKTVQNDDKTKTFIWEVVNPINNYGVNFNVGDYVHFSEQYHGEKGMLDCDYYVLSYNLDKAKNQFREVPRMLEAFERWFGPYPFYEDGYKLVEVPYPGMEHQSSVTYGNGYKNGYGGRDVSGTGIGMEFDFIIVHESGHEWFANNITYRDIADMWVHEGFTAYSESLFVDYHFGPKYCNQYVIGTRQNIRNDRPIIGVYDVNYPGSGDMYSKGSNMLHTLRQIAGDDKLWMRVLRGLNQQFYHQTVTSKQIEDYIGRMLNRDLGPFFDQYLRDTRVPIFAFSFSGGEFLYRWEDCVEGFDMPIKFGFDGDMQWLEPTTEWQSMDYPQDFGRYELDPNFYVIMMKTQK